MVEQATFLLPKVEFENMVMSMLIINPGGHYWPGRRSLLMCSFRAGYLSENLPNVSSSCVMFDPNSLAYHQGSQWACSWPYFQTQVLATKKLLAQACSSRSSTLCTQYISRYIWNWTTPHTISQNVKKHPRGLRMDSEAYIDTSESESKAMITHVPSQC